MPIVKQIAKGRAPRSNHSGQPAASCRRNFLKFVSIQISKQLRPLSVGGSPVLMIDAGINVAVCDENVEQSIIIKIQEPCSPCKERNRRVSQTRPVRYFGEIAAAFIPVESVVVIGEGGNIKIHFPVAVVVAYSNTH